MVVVNKKTDIFKRFIVVDMFACMLLEKNKPNTVVHMLSSFYSYISHFDICYLFSQNK